MLRQWRRHTPDRYHVFLLRRRYHGPYRSVPSVQFAESRQKTVDISHSGKERALVVLEVLKLSSHRQERSVVSAFEERVGGQVSSRRDDGLYGKEGVVVKDAVDAETRDGADRQRAVGEDASETRVRTGRCVVKFQ